VRCSEDWSVHSPFFGAVGIDFFLRFQAKYRRGDSQRNDPGPHRSAIGALVVVDRKVAATRVQLYDGKPYRLAAFWTGVIHDQCQQGHRAHPFAGRFAPCSATLDPDANHRKPRVFYHLALPARQIANLAAYANTREGLSAKVATFVDFLPVIALTTACWAAGWVIVVWLALRLVN